MKKYERVKALVSLDAIAHNFEEMHKNVMAMVPELLHV